jgi:hypothetical protein
MQFFSIGFLLVIYVLGAMEPVGHIAIAAAVLILITITDV